MLFPHTRSRRLELRPASADDRSEFVRTLLRTGIESVTPARARATLDSSAAFLVALRSSGDVVGFATLHGLDPAGHLRSGLYLDPERAKYGVGAEGMYLTTNYAFAAFPVDKLLGQTTEATFGSIGVTNDDEAKGVLDEHLYFQGRHWNLHNFEVTRSEWNVLVDGRLGNVLGEGLSWRHDPNRTPQHAV
ncbi:GNAT family N-acetyltransferase [Streptomyces lunaelactis]|uniref:GNAT family N-acetyltransferase n=1 Tax=Streptomyces lunaelactis TaxID=1535768 RepID=UPI0015845FCA|nr:GNAT family protein [Streptomyces lunaelactis]NUK25070.1 GNAT family N-acetyltransferase [Streptomyces lunaelactis]NUK37883.1 GNAT family N-acetyltransferase [Streptomyces lunaelactis]NUK44207.1 GNAT family N-acetyltransferase [Streptomyces lunaelactis]NUK94935.1 GNAT family N-acetyltransferase [Streptomyces lunaelactis]NUL33254.1 GNAT family N-acetyltransferase [Streptomyces lunaelactis]